ncbi:hypothetical protein CANINC_004685 [Pichia inconspicua]|uniref:Uncharacterized protein n=1 Tax=Pichia inconspicua TaxID=52247 RepID=A0A4T0WW66_9ASCO|nr:hypothetical protein CANINC_004685 [[Candida] inconspicua]
MSTDITAGVEKLALSEEKNTGKGEKFDINWDAAVTDSWVDDNFDIDASVREADAWVSDNESDESIYNERTIVQNNTPSRVRRKSERRDTNARVKQQTKNITHTTDLADIMRGIQSNLGDDTRQNNIKMGKSKASNEATTSSPKAAKSHTRRHPQTHSSPPSSAANNGFKYQPPVKPRGKGTESKQTLPSIWSEENQTAPAKVDYAATREHYAAKKALWHQQQMEQGERKEEQKNTKPKSRKAPAHSHFSYSDDDESTSPATQPATQSAPAPRAAEPLPSMWA